jgi:hypothetical protein
MVQCEAPRPPSAQKTPEWHEVHRKGLKIVFEMEMCSVRDYNRDALPDLLSIYLFLFL